MLLVLVILWMALAGSGAGRLRPGSSWP
jgi:hypothetical protein